MQTLPRLLFISSANSARSIMAQFLIHHVAPNRFETASAGEHPTDQVHPLTLRVLEEYFGIDASGAKPQGFDAVADTDFDLVISLCDPKSEHFPELPGLPATAHWTLPDPTTFWGDEEERYHVFKNVAVQIQARLQILASLPIEKLERQKLQTMARDIGSAHRAGHFHRSDQWSGKSEDAEG